MRYSKKIPERKRVGITKSTHLQHALHRRSILAARGLECEVQYWRKDDKRLGNKTPVLNEQCRPVEGKGSDKGHQILRG